MNDSTDSSFILLHPNDNVAVAARAVPQGTLLPGQTTDRIARSIQEIGLGHKVAIREIPQDAPILKFGHAIGVATCPIAVGEWVHTHNVTRNDIEREYAFCSEIPPEPTPIEGRTFRGFRRADGRAATRNYVAVIGTANCSAHVVRQIARRVEQSMGGDYPNIDGIVALTHTLGCAIRFDGEEHNQLARTLAGHANHPNVAACLLVGLGCEVSQGSYLKDNFGLVQLDYGCTEGAAPPLVLNIQDEGGTAKTIDRGCGILRELLPHANRATREEIPVSELILGTECGGSDGNSGITANPAVGVASDLLVAHGGTVILAETPEICGGEQIITRRAVSPEVAQQLIDRIEWWQDYSAKLGGEIDNNPSVGNKKGGLTTIYEKSLGAIAKGGSTALKAVYRYAEPVTEKGLVIMDTPGYDPYSVPGLVAGGAHVVAFTTGRGSCYGYKPSPVIKVATNTPMYERMTDDMDIDAGRILNGLPVEAVGDEIFEKIIAVASGEYTKSERQGIGEEEFCPWTIGPVL